MTQDSMGLFLPDRQIPSDFCRPRWPRFPFLFLFFLLRFFIGLKGLRRGKGEGGGHFAMTAGHIFRIGEGTEDGESKKREIK